MFTGEDIRRIEAEGLTEEKVLTQLEIFKRGAHMVRLNRPCTVGDGITIISEEDKEELIAVHDEAAGKGRMLKFVPSSGAASRMFRDWYRYYEMRSLNSDPEMGADFAGDIDKYAFYDDLTDAVSQGGYDIRELMRNGEFSKVLEYILTGSGLNYAHLPKALLKFHVYPDRNRTSLEEHLVEAVLYVRDAESVCRIHCTVSEEHKTGVEDCFSRVRDYYENRYGVTFDFRLSTQLASTNTIAVDMENRPFRDGGGDLVFRPGGHGALLENLNTIDGDIIFLKNIDNVVPDRLKEATVRYKKILGGYLVRLQEEIFEYLRLLSSERIDEKTLLDVAGFCEEGLNIVFPPGFNGFSDIERKDFIVNRLNRPLRICGMVKNVGEPGGGPFWVEEEDGTQSLQIIESAQLNMDSEQQKAVWTSATHFNPVDLVCGVRDYRSNKFDLDRFVDRKAALIAQKSQEGRDLKALELPGLWNGSMARWNTVFMEVPIETFNPVKTVNDLLREQHRPL
ncbi:MAG: DUF4301 family protein [Proteobacteria bacterium]|nr:DUF4301 family protein [Pseudomonadota bacterium]